LKERESMSVGNNGSGAPDEGDDPFAYLYRPEGGEPRQPQAPRQPSYNQVRPVGERSFGGQQQGYRTQPQPDAYYAAPETQPGGRPPGGTPAPAGHRAAPPEPRRTGLLLGAIGVVLAVVVGVGAAVMLSGGDDTDATGNETPGPTATEDASGGGGDAEGGDDEPTGEEEPAGELPEAELSALELGNGVQVESSIEGARSADGSYVAVQGRPNGSVGWTVDFQGEPGQYYFYIGYAAISDGQSMGFTVNGTPRPDPVDMQDYGHSGEWPSSWYSTWKLVDLVEGENTFQLTCGDSCDVLIDQVFLTDHELSDQEMAERGL
jgi:hypothetical protein